jgi:glycerophosphoryl diester phosphodiesterase
MGRNRNREDVLLLQRVDPLLVNVERRHAQALVDEGVDEGFSDSPAAASRWPLYPQSG